MTRRWIALLAVCLLAVGTATSCGGDDDGGGDTAKGTGEITIFSLWGGSEQKAFQKVLTQFTADTGIKTKYESARDFLPVIRTRLAADNPPMVAIIPRPGFVAELAQDDALIPLEDLGLDPDKINENYADVWTDLATVDDTVYGVVAKANSKSTVWYKPKSFQENSFQIPEDWNGLINLTKQYKAKGKTPWAVGAQGDDNSWTLTDWFEQIYVRQAGPEKYSQLFETGEVKFNDQSVKDALNEMVKIVNDQYVEGGIDTALGISFVDGIGRVFGKNPKAEMYYEGGFVGGIAIGPGEPEPETGHGHRLLRVPGDQLGARQPGRGRRRRGLCFRQQRGRRQADRLPRDARGRPDLGLDGRNRLTQQRRDRGRLPERSRQQRGAAASKRQGLSL